MQWQYRINHTILTKMVELVATSHYAAAAEILEHHYTPVKSRTDSPTVFIEVWNERIHYDEGPFMFRKDPCTPMYAIYHPGGKGYQALECRATSTLYASLNQADHDSSIPLDVPFETLELPADFLTTLRDFGARRVTYEKPDQYWCLTVDGKVEKLLLDATNAPVSYDKAVEIARATSEDTGIRHDIAEMTMGIPEEVVHNDDPKKILTMDIGSQILIWGQRFMLNSVMHEGEAGVFLTCMDQHRDGHPVHIRRYHPTQSGPAVMTRSELADLVERRTYEIY